MNLKSPLIENIVWGQVDVEGIGNFRDVKLYPGGGRVWDWSETGTHHEPGIQISDIEELLVNGADNIVLSKGMWKRLKTTPDALKYLEAKGVAVYVAETIEAVAIYNSLAKKGKSVGGLFHSTC